VFCLVALIKNPWGQNLWGLEERAGFLPGWFYKPVAHLGGIARTSLIATAATTPFAIYHFQSFNLYGFAANMAAIPITSFWVMPSILMAYLTAPFGLDGPFIDAAGLGVALTIRIATIVAAWPHALFFLPSMPGFSLILAVIGGAWVCIWRSTFRWLGLIPVVIGLSYPLYTPQPDFFVSPDGRVWGARLQDGTLAVPNLNRNKFILSQWQQMLGMPNMTDTPHAQLACDSEGCVYRKDGHSVAMPQKESALAEDCDRAEIVVTPVTVAECEAPIVIDEKFLQEHGAQAIYIDGGQTRVISSHSRPGERPWSVGWNSSGK
jgi:competence protein ComEC